MLANIFLENNGVPVHEALIALTIVHVMLFLAWLGVDTGVFYTSWRLRRAGLSAETRLELTRVLVFLDRSPRMASLLMVPIALSLAFTGGLGLTGVSDVQMNAIFWPILVLMAVMSWALVRFEREQEAGRTNTPFVRGYTWLLKLIKVGIFTAFMAPASRRWSASTASGTTTTSPGKRSSLPASRRPGSGSSTASGTLLLRSAT